MERKVWVSASGIIIQGLQMITAKLWISDTVLRNSDAYEILKEFAEKNGITGKEYYHLGLLTEETLGMANQILHVYDGELWVEGTAAGYEIILEAAVHENDGGKTVPAASPEGFMAKIAEMMNCSYMFENIGGPGRLAAGLHELRNPGGKRISCLGRKMVPDRLQE